MGNSNVIQSSMNAGTQIPESVSNEIDLYWTDSKNGPMSDELRNVMLRYMHNSKKVEMSLIDYVNTSKFTINSLDIIVKYLSPVLLLFLAGYLVESGLVGRVAGNIANSVNRNRGISKQNLEGDAPIYVDSIPEKLSTCKESDVAKSTEGLTEFLDAGGRVNGSQYDKRITPLIDMSEAAKKRWGYADADGYWTDRAWDRATSADYQKL
jgi:hypothetical protein